MTKVLLINHDRIECGTYQLAKRISDIVIKSDKIDYQVCDIGHHDVYERVLEAVRPDFIVYNYHWDRMPWLTEKDILENKSVKHYFVFHDGSMLKVYDKYLFFGDFDPEKKAVPIEKRILLPRPLLKYTGDYPKNKVITIGSFGFATPHKRFPELVKLVCDTFPKAIIRLHLARPYFGDNFGYNVPETISECMKNNTNTNVKLIIETSFVNDDELLEFLAGNDINVFYYSEMPNPGLSSALDYALSVRRPIAITNNMTFRHVANKEILMEYNSLFDIMRKGTEPLEKFYKKWSPDALIKEMDAIFQ